LEFRHKMEKDEANKDKVDLGPKTSKVFKKILLSVHGLTLVLSLIIFICGLVTNLNHLAYHEAWHASYGIYNGSVLSMVIGIILTAIAILGMVGTLKENYCILLSFCITLGLIVVLEVVLAVSLFALADKSKLGNSAIAATMTTSLEHFNQSGYNGVTKAWDLIQTELTCCGVSGPSDWHNDQTAFKSPFLPESCCAAVQLQSLCRIDNKTFGPYEKGCLEAFVQFIHYNSGLIASVVAIVCVIQVIIIVITSQLMRKTEKPKSCPPFY